MRRTFTVVGLLAMALAGFATRVEAVPVLSIQPGSQIVNVGDTVTVDVWISDLAESIGAFDIDVEFNSGILTGDSFAIDPDVPQNFENDFDGTLSLGFSGGLVNLYESGDPAGANLALENFRLASITFTAANLGRSPVSFDFINLSNEQGTLLLGAQSTNGEICVVAVGEDTCPPVPEPGLLGLLGAGAAAFAARQVRRRRA
jgi:hypothetical protein